MKSDERKRVLDNRDCIYILNKELDDISEEEKIKLREKYTGYGSMSLKGRSNLSNYIIFYLHS